MGHHTKGDLCKTKSESCFVDIEVCFVCQNRRRRTPVIIIIIMLVKWNTKLLAEKSFPALSCIIITAFHKGCCGNIRPRVYTLIAQNQSMNIALSIILL